MSEMVTSLLLILGSLFCFIAALGMLRLPDTITRMHAATKAGTLGAGLILIAEATYYHEVGITLRSLAVIVFLLLTAPVAAHLIGCAAYRTGIKLWKNTWIDQLGDIQPQAGRGNDRLQTQRNHRPSPQAASDVQEGDENPMA
jgi:multicomponent Na+:H+ antiporter subunit G